MRSTDRGISLGALVLILALASMCSSEPPAPDPCATCRADVDGQGDAAPSDASPDGTPPNEVLATDASATDAAASTTDASASDAPAREASTIDSPKAAATAALDAMAMPASTVTEATTERACYYDQDQPVACANRCATSADCNDPGHACIDNPGGRLCDLYCDSTLCGAHAECATTCGSCEHVDCGLSVPCDDASDVCSVGQHRCFPRTGSCSSDDSCPGLNGFLIPPATPCGTGSPATYGSISCSNSQCRWQQTTFRLAAEGAAQVQVLEPTYGTDYPDEGQIVFRWAPTSASLIVYVLNGVSDWTHLMDHAIWGFASGSSSSGSVSWDMGQTVDGGQWTTGAPMAPTNIPLYLVVEEVDGGNLVGVSDLVPFVVGPAWPEVGSACSERAAVPDECYNPARPPQLCYNGSCRRLCASDADCTSGSACGDALWLSMVGGSIRYCQ